MGPSHPKEKHDVVIYQATFDLPDNLRESLHTSGYATFVITEISELVKSLAARAHPILCIYCGPDSKTFDTIATAICEKNRLHEYPLIMVGHDANAREPEISSLFPFVSVIGAPYKPRDIIEAIGYVSDSYATLTTPPVHVEPQESVLKLLTPEHRDFISFSSHSGYTEFTTIPDLLFSELSKLNLLKTALGGNDYVTAIATGKGLDANCTPSDPRALAVVENLCTKIGQESAGHLHRVAFITDRIAAAIALDTTMAEDTKTASFLFAWALADGDSSLLKKEYLDDTSYEFRTKLSAGIQKSGEKIGTQLHKPVAAAIVASLAKLVTRERPVSDDQVSMIASTIMAADMMDRTCYYLGKWNPHGAYLLMRKFKAGDIKDIHPQVLACTVKLVSEAVTSFSPAVLVRRTLRNDPVLLEEARRVKDQPAGEHEEKMPLSNLAPGMKITRPLKAFDGRLILNENMVLDQDLIWRIWQLCAVRPLNHPLMIVAKS